MCSGGDLCSPFFSNFSETPWVKIGFDVKISFVWWMRAVFPKVRNSIFFCLSRLYFYSSTNHSSFYRKSTSRQMPYLTINLQVYQHQEMSQMRKEGGFQCWFGIRVPSTHPPPPRIINNSIVFAQLIVKNKKIIKIMPFFIGFSCFFNKTFVGVIGLPFGCAKHIPSQTLSK